MGPSRRILIGPACSCQSDNAHMLDSGRFKSPNESPSEVKMVSATVTFSPSGVAWLQLSSSLSSVLQIIASQGQCQSTCDLPATHTEAFSDRSRRYCQLTYLFVCVTTLRDNDSCEKFFLNVLDPNV